MNELIEIEEMESIDIDDAPAQLTTSNPVIVGVPMMDEQEARACVTRIKTRIDVARGELLELKDREGWKALGYSSWGVCARQEFGGSAATLYRQVEAAEIERSMGDSQIENRPIPTSQLQAVKQLAPDQRVEAFKRADQLAGDEKRTAAHVQQAVEAITAPAPDLADILKRLDAHGYAKSSTREKGITTFYSFRDYRNQLDDGEPGEIELAEGELPYWLAELDANAAYAQAKQERYLEAQARAARLGYDFKREGAQFLLTPAGQRVPALRGTLDTLIKTIEGYEKNASKKAAAAPAPDAPDLPPEFAIVQRRFAAHGWKLIRHGVWYKLNQPDGTLYNTYPTIEKHAAMLDVLDRAAARQGSSAPDHDVSDRAAHLAKEARDAGRIERARSLIEHGEHAAARTVLDQIEVATHARDQLLTTIPVGRTITLALTPDDCAALLKEARRFTESNVTRDYPTFSKALLLLVEAIKQS